MEINNSSKEMYIRIQHEIEFNGLTPSTASPTNPNSYMFGGNGFNASLSPRTLVIGARKLLAASGNEQMQKVGQEISTVFRWGMKGAMAASGRVDAMVDLAVDIATEAITIALENKKKIAKINNEADMSLITSGLMDLSNVNVSINSFTGRLSYGK